MDKNQETSYIVDTAGSLIKTYYSVKEQEVDISKLIKELNKFFNTIKDWQVDSDLLDFLYEMSVFIGLPQYFEMYLRFSKVKYEPNLSSSMLAAKINESSLVVSKTENGEFQKVHKYQKAVIDKFSADKLNRYFLTAPTSFGKTFIVNEIIKKLKYNRVVLIFPTLSLLAENYAKLLKDKFYSNYKIFTLSNFDVPIDNEPAIWIYTPERFMTMTDKYPKLVFDFVFMDEVYKIDNEFIIDKETVGENERDISFRIALNITCKKSKDFLLAGPYINIPKSRDASIIRFLEDNEITNLDYNNIEIVDKEVITVSANQNYTIDGIDFLITNQNKHKRLAKVIRAIENNNIVYVDSRYKAESLARSFAKTRPNTVTRETLISLDFNLKEVDRFGNFLYHLRTHFSVEWVLLDCLRRRIGIHHGYIPKYIQKEVIHFFNVGILDCIFSTTTITEGVNTSAKNMIVMSDKKGDKPLKKFDAQNIAGRAGRFIYHFKGRVIAINNDFESILNSQDSFINLINYDKNQDKKEVDIMITGEKYLTDNDKKTKKMLLEDAKKLGIPDDIIEQYKSISLRDKIELYKSMMQISTSDRIGISNLASRIHGRWLDWDGFEIVLKYIEPIIKNDNLKRMAEDKRLAKNNKIYSTLTVKVSNFVNGGFNAIYNFERESRGSKVDKAVRDAAELSFNLLRYHLVKYLGLFDLIFRNNCAVRDNCKPDDVLGLSGLLQLLEYSSLSENGRIVSDYGVPFNVLHYIETHNSLMRLDNYEKEMLVRIKELFNIE